MLLFYFIIISFPPAFGVSSLQTCETLDSVYSVHAIMSFFIKSFIALCVDGAAEVGYNCYCFSSLFYRALSVYITFMKRAKQINCN